MSKQYYAVTIEENGKYCAFAVTATEGNNLLSVFAGIKNIISANYCPTKKRCEETVFYWNECYQHNGTYLYDTPTF